MIQQRRGNLLEAQVTLEMAVGLKTESSAAHASLGSLLAAVGHQKEAIQALEKAVQVNPYYWFNYNDLGGAYLRSGDNDKALKAFLFERMYRHYRVNRMSSKARRIVQELFRLLHEEPECLPTEWRQQADGPGAPATARVVADYIAGMTDRFALDEHARLFDRYAKP